MGSVDRECAAVHSGLRSGSALKRAPPAQRAAVLLRPTEQNLRMMRHASHLRAAARAVGVAVIAALTFSACAAGSASGAGNASGATPTGPTRVVIDIAGTEVTVPEHPERVVALSEPALDGLLALGVTPIGTVTGRGQSAVPNYLAELAGEVPALGGIAQPNFEAIGAAQPDLIVVDGASVNNNPPVIAALRQIAPVVYTGYARGDWKVNFRHVADALNMVDAGEEVIAAYEGRIAAARPQLSEYADSTFSPVAFRGSASERSRPRSSWAGLWCGWCCAGRDPPPPHRALHPYTPKHRPPKVCRPAGPLPREHLVATRGAAAVSRPARRCTAGEPGGGQQPDSARTRLAAADRPRRQL